MTALATSVTAPAAGTYVHWGVIQLSLTNLLIIAGMIVVFVLALVLPFPRPRAEGGQDGTEDR